MRLGTRATLACAVAIAMGLIGAANAQAALSLTNGSFENPEVTDGQNAIEVPIGDTDGGWTNHSDSADEVYYVHEQHNGTDDDNGNPGGTPDLDAQGDDTQLDSADDQVFEHLTRIIPGQEVIQYQSLGTVGSKAVNATLDGLFAWRKDQSNEGFPDFKLGLYTDAAGTSPLGETVKPNHYITDWTRISASASNIAPGTEVFAVVTSFEPAETVDDPQNELFVEDMQLTTSVIPEPGSLALLAPAGLALMRRRRS